MRSWVEVSLGQIRANYRAVRKLVGPDIEVMAVVKADAYRHGSVEVSRALEAEGANWLAVSNVEEGVYLRRQGIQARILVMADFLPEERAGLEEFHLTPVIHALEDSYSHQSDPHRRDFSKRFNDLVPGKLKWLRDWVPGGFGHGIGHGVEGHTPDQTWRRPDLGMLMAEDVYREMVNLCVRYTGTACATHSFESLRPRVRKFIEFQPDRYVQWKFEAYPVEDVIDYTDKIRILDPTYSIDHDEWAIRHGEYVKALSQDVRKWTGHKIYHDPHVIKGVVTNPDPDSVSGCKCWIGLGE